MAYQKIFHINHITDRIFSVLATARCPICGEILFNQLLMAAFLIGTSWQRPTFRIIGLLCWENTGYRGIPSRMLISLLLIWISFWINSRVTYGVALTFMWRHSNVPVKLQLFNIFKGHINYAGIHWHITVTSQISCVSTVCLVVFSGAYQIKNQRPASLAFGRQIHRWPGNSPHRRPVTQKKLPLDDVIMQDVCMEVSDWYYSILGITYETARCISLNF